jgi:hypothetical protein
MEGAHERRFTDTRTEDVSELSELIKPPPVHSDPLHVLNADELNAYIIAAIPMIGKIDQALRGGL